MNATDIGPCLELDVGHDAYGYAMLYRDGKMVRAHRQAWIDAHGPIPRTTLVCHRCDNPRCSRVAKSAAQNEANRQGQLRRWALKKSPPTQTSAAHAV